LLTSTWRLPLLFVVSGSASAMRLLNGGDTAAFLPSRLARLGIPLLFGMAVILLPQPWFWLVTHVGHGYSFAYAVAHGYYRFQISDGVTMRTWMQLWLVACRLLYTLILAGLLTLPARWPTACAHATQRMLATSLLLPIGML
jgi:hypothetical protein